MPPSGYPRNSTSVTPTTAQLATCSSRRTGPACSGGSSETETAATQQDWGGSESYSEGVVTEMTEVKPGEWKITAERPAGKEEVAAVLKHFGSVKRLREASIDQIQEVPGVGPGLAAAIHGHLRPSSPPPADPGGGEDR